MEKKLKVITDRGLFISLALLFVYAFWYQYVSTSNTNLFSLLGIICLFFCFSRLKLKFSYYQDLSALIAFMIFCSLTLIINDFSFDRHLTRLISMYKYMIPLLGIYLYVDGERRKFKHILVAVCITTVLMFLSIQRSSIVYQTGAVTFGSSNGMNTNVLSSIICLGLFSALYLLFDSKNKAVNIILIIYIMYCLYTQILAASRRGFIEFCFLLILSLYSYVQIRYKKKVIVKLLGFLALFLGIYFIYSYLSNNSSSIALMQRFLIRDSKGDQNRVFYMHTAFDLFKQSPIIGMGLGSVEKSIGIYSHSLYLELIASTGIVGTLILLGLFCKEIIFVGKKSFAKNNTSVQSIISCRLVFAFIISILIGGICVVYIYDLYFYIMISLILAHRKIILFEQNTNASKC